MGFERGKQKPSACLVTVVSAWVSGIVLGAGTEVR